MTALSAALARAARFLVFLLAALFVSLVVLVVYLVRNSPPLQPWHTSDLTEEFTAHGADQVRTFTDYLALEVRLFAELEESVYAETKTGPAYALARYSADSLADPRRRDHDWNRSFELPAAAPVGSVLLLHGMSDSPYSLRALGIALNRRGYRVLGLRLPGHGTAPSGMTTVTWEDMAAAVRIGVAHLADRSETIPLHIIGYSTGAPLALDFALDVIDGRASPLPASLVLVSPAIGVSRAAAIANLKNRLALLPGLETFAWTQILPEFDPFKYNSFASNAAYQVHRLTRAVAGRVAARGASGPIEGFPPTLVFLSSVDATVTTEAVIDNLLEHLAPEGHELVLFDINRRSVPSTVMIADPGPLTARLISDGALPFWLTLITNPGPDTRTVVARREAPFSTATTTEPIGTSWPPGVISLSHIALPFPPDDPLYGRERPAGSSLVFLGQIAVQGERGLLLFPADWLIRLRHNPFYAFLEARTIGWLGAASASSAPPAPGDARRGGQ